jgi:diguanylate cyclase (GGDEF)-like protein
LPYYFYLKSKNLKKELFERNVLLKIKRKKILLEHKESLAERQRYESNMERIRQFYIIGEKLFKCVSKDEYSQIVLNYIEKKLQTVGCCIFERVKFSWKRLVSSGALRDKSINSLEFLKDSKKCSIIKNEEFENCDFKMVYWPLKIEDELIGYILILTGIDYADVCVEEGLIFTPQISLCLERINFFSEISEKSRNDGLTGLYLKRYFLQRLDLEMERKKRYNDGFYILMLDLDYFKNVNDRYGHLMGDKVLANIARLILSTVRPGDLVGRYGGEEFIILMPTISREEVKIIANKIKNSVQNVIFKENGNKFNVTISIGIGCNSKNIADINFIINTADKALYKAKNNGRDQVVLYDEIL